MTGIFKIRPYKGSSRMSEVVWMRVSQIGFCLFVGARIVGSSDVYGILGCFSFGWIS